MKKTRTLGIHLSLLPLLGVGQAQAEWVDIGGKVEQGLTVYLDPDTVHRSGDVVTFWALLGYKTLTGKMGSGDPVFSNSQESKWEPIAPDSMDRKLLEVACSKK